MLKRKIFLLIICFAALCLNAAPAMADLFHFSVHRLDMTYDGTIFEASLDSTFGGMALTRDVPTISTVTFGPESGNFNIWMNISNFTSNSGFLSADGVGEFTLTDIDNDTITGNVSGKWHNILGIPFFAGIMYNVNWKQEDPGETDNLFNRDDTFFASMLFGAPQPWSGTLIQLTAGDAPWFGDGAWSETVTGGSVGASVVPVPAAVILGILGLGVAGVKLRKFA